MLALLVAVALAQCTKDTDCKGERVCTSGECVEPNPLATKPAPATSLVPREQDVAAERVRIIRMGRLEAELRDLRYGLEDATLGGPIFKLVAATAFTVLGALLIANWGDGLACASSGLRNCGGGAAVGGGGFAASAAAIALWIWGGVQLRLRIGAREQLPMDIAAKEAELALERSAGR